MNVGAIILAAHKSEQMEQNKFLLTINGKTIIESVLDTLAAADIKEQVVVLGYEFEKVIEVIRPRLGKVKIALNLDYESGIASSLQNGLIVLSGIEAVFLVLGDELIFDPKLLNIMIEAMETSSGKALIVSPIYNGKKGHPLLFHRKLFGELLSLKPTQIIDDVINAHSDRLVLVEVPERTTIDLDTS